MWVWDLGGQKGTGSRISAPDPQHCVGGWKVEHVPCIEKTNVENWGGGGDRG
jgi:hypothetical protein